MNQIVNCVHAGVLSVHFNATRRNNHSFSLVLNSVWVLLGVNWVNFLFLPAYLKWFVCLLVVHFCRCCWTNFKNYLIFPDLLILPFETLDNAFSEKMNSNFNKTNTFNPHCSWRSFWRKTLHISIELHGSQKLVLLEFLSGCENSSEERGLRKLLYISELYVGLISVKILWIDVSFLANINWQQNAVSQFYNFELVNTKRFFSKSYCYFGMLAWIGHLFVRFAHLSDEHNTILCWFSRKKFEPDSFWHLVFNICLILKIQLVYLINLICVWMGAFD